MEETKRNGIEILDYFRVNPPTIPQMFYNTVKNAGNRPAHTFKSGRQWKTISYNEWATISEEIALALIRLGLKKGDDACIMSRLSAPRAWADMGIMLAGAVSTTITPLISDEELVYILNRSDVKIMFVENEKMLNRVVDLSDQAPSLKGIICLDEAYSGNQKTTWGLGQIRDLNNGTDSQAATQLPERWQHLTGDDPARLNYTIGTTGQLKCSQMKHREWVDGEREGQRNILRENLNGRLNNIYTSIMPITSIKERTFGFFSMVAIGAEIKYGAGPSNLKNLRELKTIRQRNEYGSTGTYY
ncbi:AMP-dependent synthetase/ligase [Syntrophomonas zehnderi OL-4]|uniref:AMP-dependent synthetase/ligase n=1 Tax=Syntrophomonas zehnderi OL-4 TaxID=690567 RepID=A0A0E4G9V3_9FIRM|nr:AMP-binding protein [Syntrophomonas zehnderi]CFW97061.1 AMP-dependent synthetase/ligase [Syntrophomonas zehnderi OL-4]